MAIFYFITEVREMRKEQEESFLSGIDTMDLLTMGWGVILF